MAFSGAVVPSMGFISNGVRGMRPSKIYHVRYTRMEIPRYLTLVGLPGPFDDCCCVLFKPFTLCSYN